MRSILETPLKEDDLVFSDLEGQPLLPDTVSHALVKLVKRIDFRESDFTTPAIPTPL